MIERILDVLLLLPLFQQRYLKDLWREMDKKTKQKNINLGWRHLGAVNDVNFTETLIEKGDKGRNPIKC